MWCAFPEGGGLAWGTRSLQVEHVPAANLPVVRMRRWAFAGTIARVVDLFQERILEPFVPTLAPKLRTADPEAAHGSQIAMPGGTASLAGQG